MRKSDTAASLHAVNLPPAPKGLSGESSRLWRAVVEGFDLPPHALMTLHVAAQALDRLRQAQRVIEADGIVVAGRQGPKPHPAIRIEEQARIAYLRAIRELGLDLEEPAASRPPTRWRS